MRKWLKRSFVILLIVAGAIQFVRPEKTNPASDPADHMQAVMEVHPAVSATFQRACNDCHSNKTVWPWYSDVAPVSWLVAHDVNEGREKLNFSAWGTYNGEKQQELLGEICKEVKENEMPGSAYTLIHAQARLSRADRVAICAWTQAAAPASPEEEKEGD